MKKNILFVFVSLFITTACLSQPRPVRNAERELGKKNISLAKEMIDEALIDPKAQEDGRSFLAKAKIYMAVFASEDPEVKALHPDPLNVALEAIEKAKTLPKINPAMVTADIMLLAGHYFNSGAINLEQGNHSRASLDLEKSFVLNKKYLNSIDTINLLYAGISAQMAGEFDRAEGFYFQLLEMGFRDADLYSQLTSLYTTQSDIDNAIKYIKLGREKFPDNLQLIFNEINVYLIAKDNEKAQEALELAISKDPENPNLYFVMGSNFNSMIDDATTDEERVFAYNEAEKAYLGALKIDPDYFDATFNLGVLYFNEGSRLFKIADDLFRDYSRENERLGLEKEKQAREYWNKSEPFFLHARDLLGINDPNTDYVSRSLRELYLRTGQTEKYQEVIEAFGLE